MAMDCFLQNDNFTDAKGILLDIEGTITPIAFVKETMYSYIRDNINEYLQLQWTTDECRADVEALRIQAEEDVLAGLEGVVRIPAADCESKEDGEDGEADCIRRAVINSVLWLMSRDCKSFSLKQFQGHMWRAAFTTGKLCSELYADVKPALMAWHSSNKKVFIYSSGSVEAQKLFLKYSDKGNCLEMIDGHFDTAIGGKRERSSYRNICDKVNLPPNQLIFFTDIPEEAQAASEASLKTCLVTRPGNTPLTPDQRKQGRVISSFAEIFDTNDEPASKKVCV